LRRSALDTNGERKTVIIGESDDFRSLAALGSARPPSPLFSPREGGVDKSLLQIQFSSGVQLLGQFAQDAFQPAFPYPLLEPAMTRLVGRISARQFTPLGTCAQDPQHSSQHSSRIMPGATATIGTPLRSQDRFNRLPLVIAEFPSVLAWPSCANLPAQRKWQNGFNYYL
jgi:hypothetical protein